MRVFFKRISQLFVSVGSLLGRWEGRWELKASDLRIWPNSRKFSKMTTQKIWTFGLFFYFLTTEFVKFCKQYRKFSPITKSFLNEAYSWCREYVKILRTLKTFKISDLLLPNVLYNETSFYRAKPLLKSIRLWTN